MSKTDFKRLDAMRDEEIDFSDIPPLTDEQLAAMRPLREVLPDAVQKKVRITIPVDSDILAWFKERVAQAGGENYQTLINDALRSYIADRKESLEDTLRRVIREELKTIGS
jgi:uncharacterized protein (DUF4415 family)